MARQPGIEHAARPPGARARRSARSCAVALAARTRSEQRAHAAQQQPGLERPQHRRRSWRAWADALPVLVLPRGRRARRRARRNGRSGTSSPSASRGRRRARAAASAPARRAVESTASTAPRACAISPPRRCRDRPERVRRRLDPDELGLARPHRRFERLSIGPTKKKKKRRIARTSWAVLAQR